MVIPEFWLGYAAGIATGIAGLLGLVHVAARWQRNSNRRWKR